MSGNDKIYLIDNHPERSEKLKVIFDFISEKVQCFSYQDWQSAKPHCPNIIVLGATQDQDATVDELQQLSRQFIKVPIVVIDAQLSRHHCVENHVIACLSFPFTYAQILEILHRSQIAKEAVRFIDAQTQKTPLFRSLVGNSDSIKKVRKLIEQVADTEATVLILGESGTGKEVVARNIHTLSSRAAKPFVPLNCGAIPAELLESELFGHEKGAFTGAITSRQGRFELANGGTLFLDEIGDMPLAMQVKLLRVLQERSFERVGSNKTIDANVRIVAATHRNLEDAIREGKFREDLYYRLNVFPIEMPPLRERSDDVGLLLNELIARLEGDDRPIIKLMADAIDALSAYHWPGNVRELANLVERLSILHPNEVISKQDLPERFQCHFQASYVEDNNDISEHEALLRIISQENSNLSDGIDLKEHLVRTELALISQALDESDWVVAHAASYLNMRRTTLVEKMRKYGLTRPERVER